MPLIQRSIKNKEIYAIFQNLHKEGSLQNYAQKLNLDWHIADNKHVIKLIISFLALRLCSK